MSDLMRSEITVSFDGAHAQNLDFRIDVLDDLVHDERNGLAPCWRDPGLLCTLRHGESYFYVAIWQETVVHTSCWIRWYWRGYAGNEDALITAHGNMVDTDDAARNDPGFFACLVEVHPCKQVEEKRVQAFV